MSKKPPNLTELTARDLMITEVVTVKQSDALTRVEREMRLGRIRHLPVVDDHGALVGIITERDFLAAGATAGRVLDHMHADPKCLHPDSAAHEAAYLLLRHRIGCVPVVDGAGVLVGLITETDVVRVAYAVLGGAVPVDELEAEEREADHV